MIGSINIVTTFAASTYDTCSSKLSGFFGLPHWWEYLKLDPSTCTPILTAQTGAESVSTFPDVVYPIALAIINILLHLAGILAFIYIVFAGARYVVSTGNPEKTSGALKSIINAAIGMAIVLTAVPVVSYLGKSLSKKLNGNTDITIPAAEASQDTLLQIMSWIFSGIGGVAVVMIVYGGLSFVLSQGKPEKAANARKTVIYALVGLIVAMSASVIVRYYMERVS